jgi:hypothetical protein
MRWLDMGIHGSTVLARDALKAGVAGYDRRQGPFLGVPLPATSVFFVIRATMPHHPVQGNREAPTVCESKSFNKADSGRRTASWH